MHLASDISRFNMKILNNMIELFYMMQLLSYGQLTRDAYLI
jgi:hypothetical protein